MATMIAFWLYWRTMYAWTGARRPRPITSSKTTVKMKPSAPFPDLFIVSKFITVPPEQNSQIWFSCLRFSAATVAHGRLFLRADGQVADTTSDTDVIALRLILVCRCFETNPSADAAVVQIIKGQMADPSIDFEAGRRTFGPDDRQFAHTACDLDGY